LLYSLIDRPLLYAVIDRVYTYMLIYFLFRNSKTTF